MTHTYQIIKKRIKIKIKKNLIQFKSSNLVRFNQVKRPILWLSKPEKKKKERKKERKKEPLNSKSDQLRPIENLGRLKKKKKKKGH